MLRGGTTTLTLLGLIAFLALGVSETTDATGVRLKLPVRRDTVVSAYAGERDANLGGSKRLKTKGIVELSLFDVNVEPLVGALVADPVLHLRSAAADVQKRVTVSTVAAEWVEGRSSGYRSEPGAASFNWAAQGERPWAWPGSDATAVINGLGHTLWAFADATPPDASGWQRVAIDPRVLAARVAGLSGGFALTDDVGTEYERVGGEFRQHVFPNRFFWSREGGPDSAPYVTVAIVGTDREPPGSVDLVAGSDRERAALRPGESVVRLRVPADRGAAGTLGFDLRFTREPPFRWDEAEEVPRYLVPIAAPAGELVTVPLRDLDLPPGASIAVGARAVDAAGNRGPVSSAAFAVAGELAPLELGPAVEPPRAPPAAAGGWPSLSGREVFVLDPLDKVHPLTGETIPPRADGYRRRNHLWDAASRTVRLAAARNEFVAFQVVVAEGGGRLGAELRFDSAAAGCGVEVELSRYVAIPSDRGPLPDPLVPLDSETPSNAHPDARTVSLLADLYVPHGCPPGGYRGLLELTRGSDRLELGVELEVWSFTLGDALSFIPQMNSYGMPGPPEDLGYYRLAHRHRTCLNLVPYNWRGEVARGYRPGGGGGDGAWKEWDARFGPLLDGSAFADLPRSGVPLDAFYLPFNENWPAAIEEGFGGGYWAERALSEGYRERFVRGVEDFAAHLMARGWNETFFEFYLNNKLYHRREGWDRSSAYWIFDEPVNTQDFWALRWYGSAFHEGVARARASVPGGRAKLVFRADVSRPQWQRDLLDGILDVNVVGIGFAPYLRTVMERRDRHGEVVYNYGTTNRVESSNAQPAAWVLWAWSVGADGVLPWKTVGKENSWRKASALALFYPGRARGEGPHPSIRLKAYRRGQQDVEYLTILAAVTGEPRWRLGERVLAEAGLSAVATQSGSQDAGRLDFEGADPVAFWRLRMRVGRALDRLAPPHRRRWVELRTPARDPSSFGAPRVLSAD